MKVVAINGSSQKKGNTHILLEKVLQPLKNKGIQTKIIWLGHNDVKPCIGCRKCFENKNNKCSIKDKFNDIFAELLTADALVLGSPVYVADVSSQMKAFIDRTCLVSRSNGYLLKRKIGAAVIAVRRAGALCALDTINHLFAISQMIIVGSTYWNLGIGREPGEVLNDAEGMENMQNIGENIFWLLEKIKREDK